MDQRVRRPAILGHEMSGVIESRGNAVEDFAPGDRVTVRPLDNCGDCPACRAGHSHICMKLKFIGIDSPGALQGLWTVPARTLHRLPDSLPLEHAALVEPIAVACHDVRLAELRAGEYAVVIGGGPIGLLVALVARERGARVLLVEPNEFRRELAASLGFDIAAPDASDLVAQVEASTGGAGADVVFEVSGSPAAAGLMTRLPRTRGRIVVVAIYPQPAPVDLFRFFWRELKLIGARVYEPEDFEEAIRLAASGTIPFDRLISQVRPLEGLGDALADLASGGGRTMKVLIDVGEGSVR
jgi:2-desacetyl-2-hydroxyethyl bacteriochlorophyllide A dehydrogenase